MGVQRHLSRGSRLITFTLITTSTPITILLLLYYTATITTNYSLWCLTQPCRDYRIHFYISAVTCIHLTSGR